MTRAALMPPQLDFDLVRGDRRLGEIARGDPMPFDQEYLQSILSYDPKTGLWRWLVQKSNYVRTGYDAGNFSDENRRCIMINGKTYKATRLAWLYMTGEWPSVLIDHKNNRPTDDRWDNLRLATRSQNKQNSRVRKDSMTGLKGVTYDRTKGRYRARIAVNGKRLRAGWFKTPEEAHAEYVRLAVIHYGEFANDGN